MNSFIKHFLFCLLLSLVTAKSAISDQIILVKTANIPAIVQITEGLIAECEGYKIESFNMKGDLREGIQIANSIYKLTTNYSNAKIITLGAPATKIISNKIFNNRIYFAMVNNPSQLNITHLDISGIMSNIPIENYLHLIQKALPGVKRVGVIYDKSNVGDIEVNHRETFSRYGLEIIAQSVNSYKEVAKALRQITKTADALIILPDSTVINRLSLKYIIATTLENNLPTIGYAKSLVERGLLFSISPDYVAMGRQLANLVCKNSLTANSTQQTFQAPERTFLSINLNTAAKLNISLSEELKQEANMIYE